MQTLVDCFQETANTSFSPDGRVLVCGTNVRPKSDETGVLKFFDVYTAEADPELGDGNVSCLCLLLFSAMFRVGVQVSHHR